MVGDNISISHFNTSLTLQKARENEKKITPVSFIAGSTTRWPKVIQGAVSLTLLKRAFPQKCDVISTLTTCRGVGWGFVCVCVFVGWVGYGGRIHVIPRGE